MSENWPYKITHVVPGEPVQAGVVNRPDRALAERTDYLKDRLDAAETGRAIFDIDATVSPDVLPGHAVYWNAAEKRYAPAIVVVENDTTTQTLTVRPSSECVGLCYRKTMADRADIVLRGLVTFPNLDNSIGQTVASGKYYLSAVAPGHLAQQKPPITVTVCHVLGPRDNCSDALRVIVCPQVRDFLDEHTHYRFELATTPAGNLAISVDPDDPLIETVSIAGANADLPGWLPADHAVFSGKAPAGAKFGYNIKKHPALLRVWPPIPMQSVALLWDKGFNRVGATEIPLGDDGVAVIDANGIWWKSNCREDVPFEESPSTASTDTCARTEKMRVVLVFLRLLLGNNRSVVTSLDTDVLSPIVIANCDGLPSTTGDLKVDIDFEELDCSPKADDEADYAGLTDQQRISADTFGAAQGGKVYSSVAPADETLNPHKNRLQKSWVAEGVIAHNIEQLTVTGTWSRPLTDAEKQYHAFIDGAGNPIADEVLAQQGLLKISFDDQYAERELSPQIVRLDDAVERLYLDIPYLGFPQGQESAVRVRFNVPYVNVLAGDILNFILRVQIFTRGGSTDAASTLGQMFLSYRVINAPTTTNTAVPLPVEDNDTTVNILSGKTARRDNIIHAEGSAITVTQGDTVLISLRRPANDAVAGELGVLRITGLLTKPS
jgi:hypothetical protein